MKSYEEKLASANAYAQRQKEKQELYDAKHRNDAKKSLSFGKAALIFMLVNCSVIEVYAMYVMFILADLSALPGLIAAVVGETATLLGYFVKSTMENRSGGVTYLNAEHELQGKHELSQEESMDQMLEDLNDDAVG